MAREGPRGKDMVALFGVSPSVCTALLPPQTRGSC